MMSEKLLENKQVSTDKTAYHVWYMVLQFDHSGINESLVNLCNQISLFLNTPEQILFGGHPKSFPILSKVVWMDEFKTGFNASISNPSDTP